LVGDEPPTYNVEELLSKVDKKVKTGIEGCILQPDDRIHEIYLKSFREALEEDSASRCLADLRKNSTKRDEDFSMLGFTLPTLSEFDELFDQLGLQFKSGPELSLLDSETAFFPGNPESFNLNSLITEESRDQVRHVDSWQSSAPLRFDHSPIDPIPLPPISALSESMLSLWEEHAADLRLAPNQSSINDFIGEDFDFEAVNLMRSSALSNLESNRDRPQESDTLQDSCQPNMDFFMDGNRFVEFLELENEISVQWKDKNSGNRALRQP